MEIYVFGETKGVCLNMDQRSIEYMAFVGTEFGKHVLRLRDCDVDMIASAFMKEWS